MSFMFLLVCIADGETGTFKRSLFEEIMSRDAVDPRFPLECVEYRDGSGSDELLDVTEDSMDGLGVSRFGPGILFDRLWELADRTGCYFAWPDEGRFIAVTNEAMRAKLPAGLCKKFEPYVVKNGHELYWAISGVDPKDAPPPGGESG